MEQSAENHVRYKVFSSFAYTEAHTIELSTRANEQLYSYSMVSVIDT